VLITAVLRTILPASTYLSRASENGSRARFVGVAAAAALVSGLSPGRSGSPERRNPVKNPGTRSAESVPKPWE
jgi:hypothetical protein